MKTTAAILLLLAAAALNNRADTLTLRTGEILTGEIASETDTDYRLRTANANYTITTIQLVAKTNVTAVVRDTIEQRIARADYQAICRHRLDPNNELAAARYTEVIALLERFLADHPASPDASTVRAILPDWRTELAQVNKGLVKFDNRWMTPADKTAAVVLAGKQARIATARRQVETLRQRLLDLQARQDELNRNITGTQRDLDTAEAKLNTLQDFTDPIYEIRPLNGYPTTYPTRHGFTVWQPPIWERYLVGEKVTRHPLRTNAEQTVAADRARIERLQASLDQTIRDLRATRTDLDKAEAALATASK